MALNPMQFLVYAVALLCCWLGRCAGLKWGGSIWTGILFAMLAVPSLCYSLYYLRVWAEPIWLYEVRSWRGSEMLAAPVGLLAGWLQARLQGPWRISFYTASVGVLLLVAAPYVKQLSGPAPLKEVWKDGICLQSSPSTCGPASAATLLTTMGVPTREEDLAKESFSTARGTENWYLRRAIERRGIPTRLEKIEPPLSELPHPSIAGVKVGGAGHFIAVLDEDADGYVIADPLHGKSKLSRESLAAGKVKFTGFFLVLSRGGASGS